MPSSPQYCRATPTECSPCFGKAVSSTIQWRTGPCRSMAGKTCSRTAEDVLWRRTGLGLHLDPSLRAAFAYRLEGPRRPDRAA